MFVTACVARRGVSVKEVAILLNKGVYETGFEGRTTDAIRITKA
jgi:hypothetical protein